MEIQTYGKDLSAVDLDGDGFDELVTRFDKPRDVNLSYVALGLHTHAGVMFEQLNFDGTIQRPFFLDLNEDGRPEILTPLVRNDSLFLTAASGEGQKLFSVFLTNGKPRQQLDGELPWDPFITDVYVLDTNGDAGNELVIVINTRFARLPRGVFVYSLPDGRLLDSEIVGAAISNSILYDFDGDGQPEVLVCSPTTNNGAKAGGFDDSRSYLILFELHGGPAVGWSRDLGQRNTVEILPVDADRDGRKEVLLAASGQGDTWLELIEPGTWRTLRKRSLSLVLNTRRDFGSPLSLDGWSDAGPEFVFAERSGQVIVFDAELKPIRRRVVPAPQRLRILPDLDGDGVVEIAANMGKRGSLLLDRDLAVKASVPEGKITGVLRRGIGNAPYVLVEREHDTAVLELVDNRFFWLYRYGPGALGVLVIGAFAFIGVVLASFRRRYRLSQVVQRLQTDSDTRGLLLADHSGRVRWSNRSLRKWLKSDPADTPPPNRLDALSVLSPCVVDLCRTAMALRPPEQQAELAEIQIGDTTRRVAVVVEPIFLKTRWDPHWFVTISEPRRASDSEYATAWPILARRVAHNLKSPLTSILLTLQRLQIEYRERAPAVANRLDRYSNRIEARIEELRRLTNNFLKFVNVEGPELVDRDLNDLIRRFAATSQRSLPPDIRLDLKLATALPPLRLDEDQFYDLLSNLVGNAINAMPDGGVVSITTCLAKGVQLGEDRSLSDYVELEIVDTGNGIPEDVRGRMFEPGFSGETEGSGLGLAIVSKIVADHNGVIEVESEVGNGSAFSVYLPVTDGASLRSSKLQRQV